MSTRSRKPKGSQMKEPQEKEEKPQAPVKVKLARPKGPTPSVEVSVRHGGEIFMRAGRGFSFGELSDAAVPLILAKRWHVPVDLRRRSVLDVNTQALKRWYEHAPKPAAPKVAEAKAVAPKVAAPKAEAPRVAAKKEPKEHKEPKAAPKKEKPKKAAPKKRATAAKKKTKS